MQAADNQRVFSPKTVGDAVNIRKKRPQAFVCAGGTSMALLGPAELANRDILSLQYVEELKRVFRSDRLVDVGSVVTLERILEIGDKVLPAPLCKAAAGISTPQIRSLATIGGNLFLGDHYLGLHSWLVLNDARYELRRANGARWIPASKFWLEVGPGSQNTEELVTRIRIPLSRWNIQDVVRLEIGSTAPGREFMFYGLCNVHAGSIEDLRIAFSMTPNLMLESRAADNDILGRKIPLSLREVQDYGKMLIADLPLPQAIDVPFVRDRLRNLGESFLYSLGRSRLEPATQSM